MSFFYFDEIAPLVIPFTHAMHPEEVHKVVTIQNAAIRSFILLQIAGGIGVKSVKDYDQDLQNSLDF